MHVTVKLFRHIFQMFAVLTEEEMKKSESMKYLWLF